MKKVTVVDYYLGNLHSVKRAFEHVGADVAIAADAQAIKNAERLVIPGVGAFGEGRRHMEERGLTPAIQDFAKTQRPLLGICLGMQLLMTMSEELGIHQGLNLIEGNVTALNDNWIDDAHYKIPHIGWNTVLHPHGATSWDDPFLKNIHSGEFFYFVHSFAVYPASAKAMLASSQYGRNEFCSIARFDSMVGCQFHPEKSGEAGLTLLKNFINL